MNIVGKSSQAGGTECIILGYIAAGGAFAPVTAAMRTAEAERKAISAHGGWELREMRPAPGIPMAPALVGWTSGSDYCFTSGRLIVVSHRWSGTLQIDDIGRKYTVDLYSRETRLVLLDAVNEILVDITSLASTANGALALPKMTLETLIAHILDRDSWFRFLERDADFDPGLARRMIERFRRRTGERVRLRLLSSLLPLIAARRPLPAEPGAPLAPAWPQPLAEEGSRLRDELRLLAAAVEGLALRGAAQA